MAILNLVVNARDAMQRGGEITIEARNCEGRPAAVEVAVRDRGGGMAKEVLMRAFDPFFTTKPVGKGSGLGLSQVYGFAKQSGGDARIESKPGGGTAVILRLPSAAKAPMPATLEEKPAEFVQGLRILLVEDDPAVANAVGSVLNDLGCSVVLCQTAAQARSMLDSDIEVDMIVSDVVTPGPISGIELAKEVRTRQPSLPVLLLTGHAQAENTAGFPLLVKPCGREELLEKLRVLARDRRATL